jgi:hypothetical protein
MLRHRFAAIRRLGRRLDTIRGFRHGRWCDLDRCGARLGCQFGDGRLAKHDDLVPAQVLSICLALDELPRYPRSADRHGKLDPAGQAEFRFSYLPLVFDAHIVSLNPHLFLSPLPFLGPLDFLGARRLGGKRFHVGRWSCRYLDIDYFGCVACLLVNDGVVVEPEAQMRIAEQDGEQDVAIVPFGLDMASY